MHHETMSRISTLSMRVLGPLSARRADRVITISEAAREDIAETLGIPRAKIDVTHLGVDVSDRPAPPPGDVRERLGIPPGPIVLSVGAKRPHKNLMRLIEAVPKISADPPPVFVLAGLPTPHEDELRERARSLGIAERVCFLDHVEEADLEALFAAASCFVLPSLQEGFGLPVLEAMSRGVPVACSNSSSLPEVAGDAALMFDPTDTAAIARAVERLLNDRRAGAAAGRSRPRAGGALHVARDRRGDPRRLRARDVAVGATTASSEPSIDSPAAWARYHSSVERRSSSPPRDRLHDAARHLRRIGGGGDEAVHTGLDQLRGRVVGVGDHHRRARRARPPRPPPSRSPRAGGQHQARASRSARSICSGITRPGSSNDPARPSSATRWTTASRSGPSP